MTHRTAFVTSAANGLGHAIVRSLFEAGWDVFFTYGASHEKAMQLVHLAKGLGRRAIAHQVNLWDESRVGEAVEACTVQLKQVDAFIHNFGPFVFERIPLREYSNDMFDRMVVGNLSNFFWIYKRVVHGMRQAQFGRIVTVGFDGAGQAVGWSDRAAYAAAKSGLASLTRSIAREERDFGITANMVCPGDIRGSHKMQMIREVAGPSGEGEKRPAVGEDIGRFVAFLCEPDSQQVNGTVTEITGGHDILSGTHRKL